MQSRDTAPFDPDAEREIDLGRLARRILARWWLVVPAAALGVVIGFLISSGGGSVFQAKSTIYLGQPLSAAGSAQIQSYQTNPSVVNTIAKGDELIERVAAQVGLRPARLRSGVSTKAVSGSIARLGQTPLVEVVVRSPRREASEDAANAIADAVVNETSTLADQKIQALTAELERIDVALAEIDRFSTEKDRALAADGLSPAERLVIAAAFPDLGTRRGTLAGDRTTADLALRVAAEVERGRVITEATATKVAARSRRSGAVVGGVIGLVVGVLAALVLPVRPRRSPPPEQTPDAVS